MLKKERMSNKITYTSTLPEDVASAVRDYAERYRVSKNAVVEQALRQFFLQEKKREFREGFSKSAGEAEIMELAEQGLQDFTEVVDRFENRKSL